MNYYVIFFIVNIAILILDCIVFVKTRKDKKFMLEQIKTISDEPEIFLDFFQR